MTVREDYPDPRALDALVLSDLTAAIDRLYPEGSQPDPLDREAAEHDVFARSHAQFYIGRQSYFDRLDAHARGNGPPLAVLGESGSGKSALLANWALRYREEHPHDPVVMHFIGATETSNVWEDMKVLTIRGQQAAGGDWAAMLRRILGELKRRFDIQEGIPEGSDALRDTFAKWLIIAAAHGRTVLILDGLDKLENREGALDLVWLPHCIPEQIVLILSTLPGRPLDELRKREWPTLTIEPLQIEERKRLIKKYLSFFTKTLDSAQIDRIAKAAQCQNPIFLRGLLDELRVFGSHVRLNDRIVSYLQAPDISSLYELILKRCEEDYERDRTGLVRESMSLLWASRKGLTEAELLEILGDGNQPLPSAFWLPFYLSIEQCFLNRGGFIGFSNGFIKQAIWNRYFQSPLSEKSIHLRLADYFEAQPDVNPRRRNELPRHLYKAEDWPRLYKCLIMPHLFYEAWRENPVEVKEYWAKIEANSSYRILDIYRYAIEHPENLPDYSLTALGELLLETHHIDEAVSLFKYNLEYYRQKEEKPKQMTMALKLANIYGKQGDLDRAWEMYIEQEHVCRELGHSDGLQVSLGNRAILLTKRGDLDGALSLYAEQEKICRESGNKWGLRMSLGLQGRILNNQGELDKALPLYEEQERVSRELGDDDGIGESLGGQAEILEIHGDLQKAMELYQEQEKIYRESGNSQGLQESLGHQGLILFKRSSLEEALRLFQEQENLCRLLGDKTSWGASLGLQAQILFLRGEREEAMRLHQEHERICREMDNKYGIAISLGYQAAILRESKDLDGAMRLFQEQERIFFELRDKRLILSSLGNQAVILADRGDLEEAIELNKRVERICREIGDMEFLATVLINQAENLAQKGKMEDARSLAQESLQLAQDHGYGFLVKEIISTKEKMGI